MSTGNADAYANSAAVALAAGDPATGLSEASAGLALDPTHPQCRINAAMALQQQGKLLDALRVYRQLLADHQLDGPVLPNLAQLQLSLGRPADALNVLDLALGLRDGSEQADVHFQRGLCFTALGQVQQAIQAYRAAVAADPQHPTSHNNLGLLLQESGEPQSAFAAYRAALQASPTYSHPAYNLGSLLLDQGLPDQAETFLRHALLCKPDYPSAAWALALCCLVREQFAEGWQLYEQRFAIQPPIPLNGRPAGPRWNLSEASPPALLVISEQGLGDTLQFLRYVPSLAARWPNTHLTVAVQRPLLELCHEALPKTIDVVEVSSGLPNDPELPWIPLLSLPLLLGLRTTSELAVSMPYFTVPEPRLDSWALRIRQASGFKLALNWQGNPSAERRNLAGRSLPLETLAPLMQLPGLTLVSVQKGAAAVQRLQCSFADRFIACQEAIDATMDFLDIAAILRCCDLLITTDTNVAHLAGGLGVPTWLLLHRPSDWRWGEHQEQTHWYPSVRLCRQPAPGRWDALVASLITPLHQRLMAHPSLSIEP